MSVSAEAAQTASKVVGGVSLGTALSSSWWMSFPWADAAIIMSCVGGLFFMIERFISMLIRIAEYRRQK